MKVFLIAAAIYLIAIVPGKAEQPWPFTIGLFLNGKNAEAKLAEAALAISFISEAPIYEYDFCRGKIVFGSQFGGTQTPHRGKSSICRTLGRISDQASPRLWFGGFASAFDVRQSDRVPARKKINLLPKIDRGLSADVPVINFKTHGVFVYSVFNNFDFLCAYPRTLGCGKSCLGDLISFLGFLDGLAAQDALPNHNYASYETYKNETARKNGHPITFWFWICAAILSLAVGGWACICGVDSWRNRNDWVACAYLALGGGAACFFVWILATRIA